MIVPFIVFLVNLILCNSCPRFCMSPIKKVNTNVMNTITIQQLAEKLKLEILAGEHGLARSIDNDDIHRPGLELTGYLTFFPSERILLFGKQEISYLHSLTIRRT